MLGFCERVANSEQLVPCRQRCCDRVMSGAFAKIGSGPTYINVDRRFRKLDEKFDAEAEALISYAEAASATRSRRRG